MANLPLRVPVLVYISKVWKDSLYKIVFICGLKIVLKQSYLLILNFFHKVSLFVILQLFIKIVDLGLLAIGILVENLSSLYVGRYKHQ
jgi:hypothetical protein